MTLVPRPTGFLKHLLPLVLASGIGPAAMSQVEVQVNDARSGAPVAYAHLAYQPLKGGPGNTLVTGASGRLELPVSAADVENGVLLRISFVGFNPVMDTIRALGSRTYALHPTALELPEMVVTGQYAPSVAERAVHKVRVLDAALFQRMAANNLADVLRNELNIRLQQDNILGSSMSMQGMGGENVKILVDGVPVIGRQDGNIDLMQLDLTGIERAEIIEGPLSVSYGTNALAGTINLITRKGSGLPFTLKAVGYAEHIGRLNTTLSATRTKGRNAVSVNAGRNFFGGWDPTHSGLPSFAPTPADSSRYQQWKPREQYFGRLNYRWHGDRWTLGYKGEALHDRIINRGRPRAPYYETAFDEQYLTMRLDNAVFAEGRLGNGRRINALAAHNRFARYRNTWFRDLTTLGEQLADLEGMQDTTRFTLTNVRATFSNAQDSAKVRYEVGTDSNLESGKGERMGSATQRISDVAVFASMELALSSRFTLRPGVRYAYNTRYDAPVIPSINMRWALGNGFTLRSSYARGFRAPSLKELYLFFVDVNHDIVGNPDLDAERSHNLSTGLAYVHGKDKGVYRSEINVFYNAIEDLITLAQVSGTRYTYINVGEFRTAGGTVGASWDNGHWMLSGGGGITARYDAIASANGESWIMSPEVRASLTRNWMKQGWTASLFWKYQGELANYVYISDIEVVRSFMAPFHMADLTVGRRMWGDRILLSAGCKDLFDVQNVQASLAGGVHSSGGTSVPMTTGRTWFLRFEMDLKKKA
jgi:outer membrane receptor for ferrienterochelin and colicins